MSDQPTSLEWIGCTLREMQAAMAPKPDLAGLSGRMDGVRADIMARIDRLQDGLSGQEQGDVVTWGRLERIEKIARDAVRMRAWMPETFSSRSAA